MGLFYTYLGAVDLGLIWGFLALGVYITFRLLDIADLTVDGSFATGGAVCAVCVCYFSWFYCWRNYWYFAY